MILIVIGVALLFIAAFYRVFREETHDLHRRSL